jgi:hypothetical protein
MKRAFETVCGVFFAVACYAIVVVTLTFLITGGVE